MELRGMLHNMTVSHAEIERKLVKAMMDRVDWASIAEFNKAGHGVEYNWYGVVAAMKVEAIVDLGPFYAASLKVTTGSPTLIQVCTFASLMEGA